MDKKEILEKSRKENKNGGEYESEVTKVALAVSSVTGLIMCLIFYIIDRNVAFFIIWTAMFCAENIVEAIKMKKLSNIVISVLLLLGLGLQIATFLSDKGVF